MLVAVVERSGVLRIGKDLGFQDGLPIGRGDKEVMERIKVHCRLAYDNKTYLVPGVPEAEDSNAAVDAVIAFRDRLEKLGIIT